MRTNKANDLIYLNNKEFTEIDDLFKNIGIVKNNDRKLLKFT